MATTEPSGGHRHDTAYATATVSLRNRNTCTKAVLVPLLETDSEPCGFGASEIHGDGETRRLLERRTIEGDQRLWSHQLI